VHTRGHYFFSNLVSDTSPPSVSAQALCFSVLDAVFGMTLEFGKPSCRLGAMWGGLCRLLDVGIIRVGSCTKVCYTYIYIYIIPNIEK